jgi:hypothetical protein
LEWICEKKKAQRTSRSTHLQPWGSQAFIIPFSSRSSGTGVEGL